jgi:hypothetical protein
MEVGMKDESQKATNLSEFMKHIDSLVREWSDWEHGGARLWYRGQSRADWGLIPGEYRFTHIDPDEIRSEFQLKARPLLRDAPQSEWEWYFVMQHHGLPTRLLDWTTGGLLALHFALRGNSGEADAAVWVLDPWSLNETSLGKAELVLSSEPKAALYLPKLYANKPAVPNRPIAVVPPYSTSRITVQRGTFTVHGSVKRGLEKLFSERLAKITIPKDSCLGLKRALRASGVGEFTVFPDLDGLCREIRSAEIEGC